MSPSTDMFVKLNPMYVKRVKNFLKERVAKFFTSRFFHIKSFLLPASPMLTNSTCRVGTSDFDAQMSIIKI
jgi:hypothetical protein